jgi:hypothetical protein
VVDAGDFAGHFLPKDVVDVHGETWLLGLDVLYRVDDDSANRIDGIGAVAGMKELAGQALPLSCRCSERNQLS